MLFGWNHIHHHQGKKGPFSPLQKIQMYCNIHGNHTFIGECTYCECNNHIDLCTLYTISGWVASFHAVLWCHNLKWSVKEWVNTKSCWFLKQFSDDSLTVLAVVIRALRTKESDRGRLNTVGLGVSNSNPPKGHAGFSFSLFHVVHHNDPWVALGAGRRTFRSETQLWHLHFTLTSPPQSLRASSPTWQPYHPLQPGNRIILSLHRWSDTLSGIVSEYKRHTSLSETKR